MIKLTERLQKIYDQVRPGESVCDVGTDHGYVPLALLESGRSPKAIMSDISAGSLAKCKVNAEAMLPSLAPFDLRQGSGIDILKSGEVDTVIMAGMGGMLISEILEKDYHHSHSFKRYILQPRKHVGRLRYWLLDNDFTVVHEDLAREGKFIWPILTVESFGRALFVNADPDDVEFEYPLTLLEYRNELTEEYLRNALYLERLKLESKSAGSLTTFEELRTQRHRVSRLEYMVNRL